MREAKMREVIGYVALDVGPERTVSGSVPAQVRSRGRGRPVADLVADLERTDPEAVDEADLSSSALRAADMIRTMRKKAGLTQAELATKIGVKPSRVSELEAGMGRQGPTYNVLERIAQACRQRIWFLDAA